MATNANVLFPRMRGFLAHFPGFKFPDRDRLRILIPRRDGHGSGTGEKVDDSKTARHDQEVEPQEFEIQNRWPSGNPHDSHVIAMELIHVYRSVDCVKVDREDGQREHHMKKALQTP